MNILVDYLGATFKELKLADLIDRFGLRGVNWEPGKGRNGWLRCDWFNGIRIYSQGREDIGIELSGVGCRCVESLNDLAFDWLQLFAWIMEQGSTANVSRLDVACDEKDGILDFDKMVKATKERKYISKARKRHWTDGDERIIMFGSSSSNTRLRIYDKALERGVDGHWIRCEFQLRDSSADSFIGRVLEYGDIGYVYAGVLNNYLRYTIKRPDPSISHNYDSIRTVDWWSRFVETGSKIKNLKIGGLEYNLDSLHDFLSKQCGSSMRTYVELFGASALLELAYSSQYSVKQKQLLAMEGIDVG